MQFRLTYEGTLLAESSAGNRQPGRANNKHEIRKKFHPQLRRLWALHPALNPDVMGDVQRSDFIVTDSDVPPHTAESLSQRFACGPYKIVPLATRSLGVLCGLDILFLRNDPPGSLITGGDIDNRVKTLLDGLTMPRDAAQLGSYQTPDADEDPFFVLLEDDSLITKLTVETDTLLEPMVGGNLNTDARVVITVTIKPYVTTVDNQPFG